MPKVSFVKLSSGLSFLFLGLILTGPVGAAGFDFNDGGFANTWNRTDKPVHDNAAAVGRGYTWGPPVPGSGGVAVEPYNGASRRVQYFDKARMEVNNPAADPTGLYYVTTGLLVKELVTGLRQDGYTSFTNLPVVSPNPVAGDSNEGAANPVAPTYASFKGVGTFVADENSQPRLTGQSITARLNRAGQVSLFEPPENRRLTDYDEITRHNLADVFGDFSRQTGLLWDGTKLVNGSLFFDNPLYVLGRPLTEPYWIRAVVAGTERDVLVQLFERRVLTYTPSNPPGFRVEMGNVGQHYYRWRYILNTPPGLPTPTPTAPAPAPTPAPTPRPAPTAAGPAVPVAFGGRGQVLDQLFYSPILSRSVHYLIYLPAEYATKPAKLFPTLYMLHGFGGDYHEWLNLGLPGRADDLIKDGVIKPMIIVLPFGEQSYWLNHANNGPRWGDYMAYDVVAFIEASYRATPNAGSRAIGGLSMGGHGALQLGFNHPEIFSIVGAHSPSLRMREDGPPYFGDPAYYDTVDPIALARTKDLSGLKLWIDTGLDDPWLDRGRLLDTILGGRNIPHKWTNWPGGHDGSYWAAHTVDYLEFYSAWFPAS